VTGIGWLFASRYAKFPLLAAVVMAILFLGTTRASAQATRTWVSGVGDDANPCSRTAPCKTFAGTIAKTAPGGLIDCLDPGGFGAVTITKSISIDCSEVFGSVLVTGTNAINVSAQGADTVVLRNLDLSGGGDTNRGLNGIQFNSGASLIVENVHIHNFSGAGILDGANNSMVGGQTPRLFVKDSEIRNTGANGTSAGIDVTAALGGQVEIDNVQLENNQIGVRFQDNVHGTIRNSRTASNTDCGFVAQSLSGGPASMVIDHSQTSDNLSTVNSCGVRSDQSGGGATVVRLSDVTVNFNFIGLVPVAGGQIVSAGNNTIQGNVTSDGTITSVIPLR
jgi:hypothetical protein